ncbi:tetratricopeptide repeat protein [Chiayiivirga flava]|uniref:Tetratricopeptide (TPR) repeat protein n=1 Tax=Chiayiivirga flava TaxID=659595 RepID=A0A7W8D4A6_9GAMM|nr:tetratricopeptide repeat protein [Chiayiivirga flava]MBB5207686.1 tetratricopeptide (TPR) repeat protein [Chiayiivirga flava]
MKIAHSLKAVLVLLVLSLFVVTQASAARGDRKEKESEKKEALYPNATRAEPEIKPVASLNKQLSKLYDLNEAEKFDEVLPLGETILAHKKAGPYEKSIVYQVMGFVYIDKDDYPTAIEYLQKALDANGLPNDTHYQIMNQIAQMQMAEEQYEAAEKTTARLLSETRSERPELLATRGNVLYRLERYDEAAEALKKAIAASPEPQESWNQLLMATYADQGKPEEAAKIAEQIAARTPNDKKAMMNLAAVYAQSDQYDKAGEVLEKVRAQGMMTDERDYRQLYAIYLNSEGKEAQAIDVINDGLAKNVLKPSSDVYIALGQAYYFTDKPNEAIDAYKKAAQYATDGEASLNLARMLSNEDRNAEAKAAAQEALKKGVKKPGDAWMVLGRAEFGLDNRAGLVAAYKEAAKYPETKQAAEEWLRKNGSK